MVDRLFGTASSELRCTVEVKGLNAQLHVKDWGSPNRTIEFDLEESD